MRPTVAGTIVRFVLGSGLASAVVLLFVSGFLPWEAGYSGWALLNVPADVVSGAQGTAVLLTVPALLFGLGSLRRPTLPLRILALLATGAGTVCAWWDVLAPDQGQQWPGLGFGLAVAGYPLAFAASLVLTVLRRQQWGSTRVVLGRTLGLRGGFGLVGVVVFALVIGVGGVWYSSGWVDASTASATAAPAPTGKPGTVLWRLTGAVYPDGPDSLDDSTVAVALPGNLVAVEHGAGGDLVVRDAATGAPRWHYTRRGERLAHLAVSADGRTVVAFYTFRALGEVFGLDAATGAVRWQRSADWLPDGEVTAVPGALVAVSADNQVTALDPDTGSALWTINSLGSADNGCGVPLNGIGGTTTVTVLVTQCDLTETVTVRAVNATGRTLWTVVNPGGAPSDSDSNAERSVLAVDASSVVLATGDQQKFVVLNAATGAVRWSGAEPFVGLAGATVLTATNLSATDLDGDLRLREAATGALAANQPMPPLPLAGDDTNTATNYAGRVYLLTNPGDSEANLVELDPNTARVLVSYPVPLTGVAGVPSAAFLPSSISPTAGYTLVAGPNPNTADIDPYTILAVRTG